MKFIGSGVEKRAHSAPKKKCFTGLRRPGGSRRTKNKKRQYRVLRHMGAFAQDKIPKSPARAEIGNAREIKNKCRPSHHRQPRGNKKDHKLILSDRQLRRSGTF